MIRDLFRLDKEETDGEVLYYKLFELFVSANVVRLAWGWALYIGRIKENVFPLGLANYIDISVFYDSPLGVWNAIIITTLSILMLVFPWRWIPWTALTLLHLQLVARDALGEISHSGNFIGMSLFAIGLGRTFARTGSDRRRFVIGMTLFFMGLGYVSAALCKLVGTGVFWVDGRHLWLWMAEKSTDILSRDGVFVSNVLQAWARQSHLLATVILSVGLLSELLGFLLWFRRTRIMITLALMGMHIGIALTMNIRFDIFIYQVALMGLPWASVFDRLLPWMSQSRRSVLVRVALRTTDPT